ncbi:6,7-dimethyl-8-ribityllumazine synthase [Fodinibius sediminis]|uniref:6,7-dimethyl-8-ribityllumazine synthase n=1 Tax=Fodinibius sediminis TaxID=1214077 RepID=A0A521E0F0_9BACT|nr:6,7-dimethyl-8-ribityllumazine synthase [Fodinibius sediminis]SMO77433.1 6,7-dimethyl-8-ribityllumazine synthase [Fodinibius sediminis]
MEHQVLKGNVDDPDSKVGIVVAKWNSFITEELLDGALEVLKQRGLPGDQIVVVYCPGAYEIPFAAGQLLPKVDGVITLGAVIRGDTPHFHYVCDAVNKGVTELNIQGNKPVVFGVLTTDNVQQAQERAGLVEGGKGNKGAEAALALLEMIGLNKRIEQL